MKTEIERIVNSLQEVLQGEPWYGVSILPMLSRVDPSKVYIKPNDHTHSMIELLYHMLTWSEFTQKRLEKDQQLDLPVFESLDWRKTTTEHTWNSGIAQLTASINKTIDLLNDYTDDLLEEQVDFREYNFRYLLNGIIQDHIYHLAQIAYLHHLLR